MPTEVATLCFHTRDAVARDDSSLTFAMPSDRLRTGAAKVALASCEFPMVQWTVEADWNRLWTCEGVRLDERSSLTVVSRRWRDGGGEVVAELRLPPRLNRVVATSRRNGKTVVQCERPHGLCFEDDGGVHVFTPALDDGVVLVGGAAGDVRVDAVEWVDAHRFALPRSAADDVSHVVCATVASPSRLCEWLTHAARGLVDGTKLTFRYDPDRDLVRLEAVAAHETMLRIMPGSLAHTLGLSTTPVRVGTDTSVEWPCEPTGLWDYVEVPPGFYSPCHRPMCTGQPLRFGSEVELATNRLYFPVTKPNAAAPAAAATAPHLLVFSDPEGRIHTCGVPCGRYTARTLCVHLEAAMTRAVRDVSPGLTFAVFHDDDDRFSFVCERRSGGAVVPAVFGLLFHHPLSFDPARLGFAPQPLSGQSTYVAPERTREPAHTRNLVRVGEVTSQKRFRFHTTTPPPLVGVVQASSTTFLVVRTHVNQMPFAHGYRPGDVVRVAAGGATTVLSNGSEETSVRENAARLPPTLSCVVADDDDDPCVLHLHAPRLDGLRDANTCLHVTSDAEPWNLCFCKPRSLPAHLVGFAPRSVQSGVDGSVGDADGRRLPPFEAPYTHSLDHPDYVLLTFSESAGAGLEHSYAGETRPVFCKLSLYPLFREERMLPRDTTLLRDTLSRFTLAFWNPDFTPYRFHGAQFSFSLNFFSAVPDA